MGDASIMSKENDVGKYTKSYIKLKEIKALGKLAEMMEDEIMPNGVVVILYTEFHKGIDIQVYGETKWHIDEDGNICVVGYEEEICCETCGQFLPKEKS